MSRHCTQGCRSGSIVVETRETIFTIRRRRKCRSCGTKWTTYEVIENSAELLEDVSVRLGAIQKTAGLMARQAGHSIEVLKGDRKRHVRRS